MASKDLTEGITITLGDVKVEVRPLTIRQLRKFVKVVKDLNTETVDLSDEDIDNMIEAARIVLSKAAPELAEDPDALEDVLDIRTFNQILSAAMGVDPEE